MVIDLFFESIFQGEMFLISRNWRILGGAASPGSTRYQCQSITLLNVGQHGEGCSEHKQTVTHRAG